MSRVAHDADLMLRAGYAVSSIARLIAESGRRDFEEADTLNGYTLGGLTAALELIGDHLGEIGEKLEKLAGQEGAQ